MRSEFDRLNSLVNLWGGKILQISEDEMNYYVRDTSFYPCPFAKRELGTLWEEKKILYRNNIYYENRWGDIIHEMGHVFASIRNPDQSNEDIFLGWEYKMIEHIGGNINQWLECCKDYEINLDPNNHRKADSIKNHILYGDKELLIARLEYAVELSVDHKLITNDVPISIR